MNIIIVYEQGREGNNTYEYGKFICSGSFSSTSFKLQYLFELKTEDSNLYNTILNSMMGYIEAFQI